MIRLGCSIVVLIAWTVLSARHASAATAEETDRVTVRTQHGGEVVLSGQIVDDAGGSLRLRIAGGREEVIPVDQIVAVQTRTVPVHAEADKALADARFDQALALYHQALETEQRRWVRRRILVGMVWCHRGLGHVVEAGQTALVVTRDDSSAEAAACLPLAWRPAQPTPELEQAARQWLAQENLPAAVLLGASHLLSVEQAAALARLKRLVVEADGPVARLAQAQIWRTEIVTADAAKTAAWAAAVETMDPPLRAGPYYVLGQAQVRRKDWEGAALALLRVPILYPRQRDLAAEALWDASQAVERLGHPQQAARLYAELAARFPETRPAPEAKRRLVPSESESN